MNRKSEEKNIRKLVRMGKTSLAVTIPRDLIVALNWREKQKLIVKKIKGGVAIRDYHPKS
jgi:hypothetical protein